MTFVAAFIGLFASASFAIPGAILRWIITPHGHQLFTGAYVIGDICLWIALAIVVFYALFGLIADVAIGTSSRW